jgi:hypothetical protein
MSRQLSRPLSGPQRSSERHGTGQRGPSYFEAAAPSSSAAGHAATASRPQAVAVFSTEGQLLSLSSERQELLCSVIGLMVKLGLVAVASLSLMRLASAYQQRMDRQGEISAVLELEHAKLVKARERFDQLFMVDGEQRLIREQSQWIAPNRLRVVWQQPVTTVKTTTPAAGNQRPAP